MKNARFSIHAGHGRRTVSAATILSLIISLGVVCIFVFGLLFGDAATTGTTDPSEYEKALDKMPNALTVFFPQAIPEQAENVQFSYNPPFAQGGRRLLLRFDADATYCQKYLDELPWAAVWYGPATDGALSEHGVFSDFSVMRDPQGKLPSDLTVYVVSSKPQQKGNWNHGESSYVAISEAIHATMFYAERW